MTTLSVAVVSITRTKRRRFLWAAWWTGAPTRQPFRKPDASNGGAATRDEALRDAERSAGRALVEIDRTWAEAWNRIIRGMPPWPSRNVKDAAASPPSKNSKPEETDSIWKTLGLAPGATIAEIKSAFRKRALETHPDHGGDPAAFRAVHEAYARALVRRDKMSRRPKRRTTDEP